MASVASDVVVSFARDPTARPRYAGWCVLLLLQTWLMVPTSILAAGIITTVAGGGSAGDGGAATSSSLGYPNGVAIDGNGNLYIADTYGGRIRRVAADSGIITTIAGNGVSGGGGDGGPATSASLSNPVGVVAHSNGDLYVVDGRVRKIAAATGIITTVAGGINNFSGDGGLATDAGLSSPNGVAIDIAGNLYIADQNNHRIRKVDAVTGIITMVAGDGNAGATGDGGPATSASVNGPAGVTLDGSGNLYIADSFNNLIRKVDLGTGIITTVAGNGGCCFDGDGVAATSAWLGHPDGVTVDGSGNIFIAERYGDRIRRVDAATGIITTVAGNSSRGFGGDGGLATSANLYVPTGVALDAGGNLYIADNENSRIRKVTAATGIITTVAGNATQGFGDGAAATAASLAFPEGVAVDAGGNLYIADSAYHRVRKVAAGTGVITTIAGDGSYGSGGDGGAATSASFSYPTGLAIDGIGNLYIADAFANRVRKVTTATGIITTVAGNGSDTFSGDGGAATNAGLPVGDVAIDSSGNLYIAGYSRIRKVTAATGIITTVAGNGIGGFSGDGGPATSAGLAARFVAVDGSGNLYASAYDHARVRKIGAATGIITTVAGNGSPNFSGDGGAATSAGLGDPTGVAVDNSGNLYIADQGSRRIRKVAAATGIITTVAGNGLSGFSGDGGPASSASLNIPRGLAVDRVGRLYVADSDNHRIRMVLLPPEAPTAVNATAANAQATVTFAAPKLDGGSAITGYTVTSIPAGGVDSDAGSAGTSHAITGLTNGTAYTFTVVAANALGPGAPSVASNSVTPSAVPGAPTAVNATAGNAKATVAFAAPASNGGSAITGYTVTSNPAGGTDSNAGSTNASHVVTGLVNGTAYTFTVKATNAAGLGPASAASNSVIPKATTTTSLSVSPFSSSNYGDKAVFDATVTGSGPTGTVTYTDTDASIICVQSLTGTGNTRTAQCNTTNLARGAHSITAAYFGNGTNAPSASSPALAFNVVVQPNPPVISGVTPGNRTAAVSFAPSTDDGGSPITGYTVTATPTGGLAPQRAGSDAIARSTVNAVPGIGEDSNAGSLATTHVVTGLTNGIAYTFTVTAINASGSSAPSAPSSSVTPVPVTSIGSNANPSLPGQSVTFTATVSGNAPTGTVAFEDGGTPLAGCAAVPLVGTQAQCVDSTLALGSHHLTALYAGDASNAGTLSQLLTQYVTPAVLDVDASLSETKYDALTDGLLVIRYLFGLTGATLTNGALGSTATRIDSGAIKAHLDAVRPLLDIDGNGSVDALTDGLLVLRYLFGLRGNALIAEVVDSLATRKTASDIEAYLQTLLP